MLFPEHIRLFTDLFYKKFPRDAGFPDRTPVFSIDDFIDQAIWKHAYSPCFLNLYIDVLEFLWIDVDDKQWNQDKVFSSVKHTYFNTFSDELKINPNDVALVFSGIKGYHYYIRNTPIPIPKEPLSLVDFKSDLKRTLSYATRELPQADSPWFTDTKRMCRIPGIKRPEGTMCFALNPQELFVHDSLYDYLEIFNFDWNKIIDHSNRWLETLKPPKRNYFAEIKQKVDELDWQPKTKVVEYKKEASETIENKNGYAKAVDRILKRTLSAETYYGVHIHNPLHDTRIKFALALMYKGFTVEDVVSFANTLNWFDFNFIKTRVNTQYLKDKYIDKII